MELFYKNNNSQRKKNGNNQNAISLFYIYNKDFCNNFIYDII